jgi:hypothetical protein
MTQNFFGRLYRDHPVYSKKTNTCFLLFKQEFVKDKQSRNITSPSKNMDVIFFIAFNCHKFSFFSFVNCLLTALKQKIADNQPLP